MKALERNSAVLIFSFYALAVFLMAIFVLMWDNKGARGFWDKNIKDWLTFFWLLIVGGVSTLSAILCYTKQHLSYIILFSILVVVVANMLYVFSWEQGELLFYYGAIHGLVIVACTLWWHSFHEKSSSKRL